MITITTNDTDIWLIWLNNARSTGFFSSEFMSIIFDAHAKLVDMTDSIKWSVYKSISKETNRYRIWFDGNANTNKISIYGVIYKYSTSCDEWTFKLFLSVFTLCLRNNCSKNSNVPEMTRGPETMQTRQMKEKQLSTNVVGMRKELNKKSMNTVCCFLSSFHFSKPLN